MIGNTVKFIDLFAGIGGFRLGVEHAFKANGMSCKCVFSSEIDISAQKSYQANFGELPHGDITKISENDIPDHDLLLAGFPCQPFSIIGKSHGFEDTRGTLFFDIARILAVKKPKTFILENVKRLVSHDNGRTFAKIIEALKNLGYTIEYKILNALDYNLPQKRERIIIVGYLGSYNFIWPEKQKLELTLADIIEKNVDRKHYASKTIVTKRKNKHTSAHALSIWHENKSGNICSYPYSCALRANASYNYLLVNGERRLTPREMLCLQGFPVDFKIIVPDTQVRKQAGNAVPVNLIREVAKSLLPYFKKQTIELNIIKNFDKKGHHDRNAHTKVAHS